MSAEPEFSLDSGLLRALRRGAGDPPLYIQDLHPKQRAFVTYRGKRRAAHPSRRAGKSTGLGAWFLDGCERKPGEKSVYIGLTRGKAKSVIWDLTLEPMDRRYKIGLKLKHDEGMLYIVHPNGHRIWVLGVDNASEVNKVRGERLFRAAVDEAQAFGSYLRTLVEEALEWALMDLDGEIALTGTPDPMCVGYFWAACTGEDPDVTRWPVFHWTILDNPGIPDAARKLKDMKTSHNWTDEHPTFMREGLGLWVKDVNALIYPFEYERNGWTPQSDGTPHGLPPGEYTFGLGVDLGFSEDSTAFVLVAVPRGSGKLYVLNAYTRSRLIPTALAVHVQQIREDIRKQYDVGLRVVVDEGALGKGYAEQMRAMGVTCEPAQKTEKRTYQEYVRGLLLSGSILADFGACSSLIEEARKLQFDIETGLEDDRFIRHCCDGFLYITRALFPRMENELDAPKPGTAAAINAELAAEKQREIKAQARRRMGGRA